MLIEGACSMKQLVQPACLILACCRKVLRLMYVEGVSSMKQLVQPACLILACYEKVVGHLGACPRALVYWSRKIDCLPVIRIIIWNSVSVQGQPRQFIHIPNIQLPPPGRWYQALQNIRIRWCSMGIETRQQWQYRIALLLIVVFVFIIGANLIVDAEP